MVADWVMGPEEVDSPSKSSRHIGVSRVVMVHSNEERMDSSIKLSEAPESTRAR